jgi:hypothetical protein
MVLKKPEEVKKIKILAYLIVEAQRTYRAQWVIALHLFTLVA